MKKIIPFQYFMMQIISINITNRRNLSKKRGRIVIVRDIFNHANCYVTLGDKSRCSAGLVFPGGGKNTLGLVVPVIQNVMLANILKERILGYRYSDN